MIMDKISIIIPVYNAERFLDRCLGSVLGQTYESIEVVAVNDGSKDGSLAVLRAYAEKDSRIHIVDQENAGVATARNVGLANASGDYILFVDADDWIEKDMTASLLSLLEGTPEADIAVCAGDPAEHPGEVVRVADPKVEIWNSGRQKKEFLTHQQLQGMLWNKLIRASLFQGLSFDRSVGYGEDAQIMWKVLSRCRNMVLTNQVYYHHVIEPTSISNQRFSPKKYSAVKVWREIEEDVRRNQPQMLTLATERLAFYATFTLYEMFVAGYEDATAEADFLRVMRDNLAVLMKAPSISAKTKVFAAVTAVSPGLARKLLTKRK